MSKIGHESLITTVTTTFCFHGDDCPALLWITNNRLCSEWNTSVLLTVQYTLNTAYCFYK